MELSDQIIRVMIVEDDETCYFMERNIIEKEPDLQIVAYAKDKKTALDLIKEVKPDVLLCDINLTDKNDQFGVDIAIELSLSEFDCKIIMLSGIINEDSIRSTLGIGVACNYILKTNPEILPQVIRDAINNNPKIEGSIIKYIMKDYQESLKSTMNKLTENHIRILQLFYREYSIEEIASIMKIRMESVQNLQQVIAKRCFGWKWSVRKLTGKELAIRAKKLGLF
jgi:DNA-binding NarL/FixJ family response regulator